MRALNGEPAVIVRVPSTPPLVVALLHIESRGGQIAALRIKADSVTYFDDLSMTPL